MTSFVVNVVFAAMVQLLGSGQGNKAFISADQSLVCLSLVLRSLGEDDELDFRKARQRQDIHCGGSLGSVGRVGCVRGRRLAHARSVWRWKERNIGNGKSPLLTGRQARRVASYAVIASRPVQRRPCNDKLTLSNG